jgi:acyl carrier protein
MDPGVRDLLVEILTDDLELAVDRLTDDAELVADLGFDSMSFATVVAEVRSRLGVALHKEDVFGCRTFGDLQRVISNRLVVAP